MKRRALLVAAALVGTLGVLGASPVKADSPADDATLTGVVTDFVNRTLGAFPAPSGTEPRHLCAGIDTINWGMCVTFPWPT